MAKTKTHYEKWIANFTKANPQNTNPLTEDQYIYLKEYFNADRTGIEYQDQVKLIQINNKVFNKNLAPANCINCIGRIYNELKELFDKY